MFYDWSWALLSLRGSAAACVVEDWVGPNCVGGLTGLLAFAMALFLLGPPLRALEHMCEGVEEYDKCIYASNSN